MRVNLYAEELTDRVEVVRKTADTGAEFIGLRFFLESSPRLHKNAEDDDSSAVTFWVRSSRGGYKDGDEKALLRVLDRAQFALNELAYRTRSGDRNALVEGEKK